MSFQCSPYIFLLSPFPVPRGFVCPAHVCRWWGCIAAQHPDPLADLLKALWPRSGCTNLSQARGTSPPHIFSISQATLHPIYVCTKSGSFYLCSQFLPLTFCPNIILCFFPSFLHPSLCSSHTRNTLLSCPKCSWQLPSWPNQEWLIQHPSAPSAFDLWSSPAGSVITHILCGLHIKQLFSHQSRLSW